VSKAIHFRDHKWFEKHDWVRVKLAETNICNNDKVQVGTEFKHILMCCICGILKIYKAADYPGC